MDPTKFKPRKQNQTSAEKKALAELGFAWCKRCATCKPLSEFFKNQVPCKICHKKIAQAYHASHPEYRRSYRFKNLERVRKYDTEWHREYRNNNREEYNKKDRIWRKEWGKEYRARPKTKFIHRIQVMLARMKGGKHGKRSWDILGVSCYEEFLRVLTDKTQNKNWFSDGWTIDHIWQIQWFSEKAILFPKEVSWTLNHHRNLRPLSAMDNFKRGDKDFSPLKSSDFEIYKPFLNNDILKEIEAYFNSQNSIGA